MGRSPMQTTRYGPEKGLYAQESRIEAKEAPAPCRLPALSVRLTVQKIHGVRITNGNDPDNVRSPHALF